MGAVFNRYRKEKARRFFNTPGKGEKCSTPRHTPSTHQCTESGALASKKPKHRCIVVRCTLLMQASFRVTASNRILLVYTVWSLVSEYQAEEHT